MSKKFTKPAPYLVQQDSYPVQQAAKKLRKRFKPLMQKRLPTVLYGGFTHGFIPQFVQQHKKACPYYLKIDIAKFYPSISHHHLTVELQMAYKELVGLNYVPSKFKKEVLPDLLAFFATLPGNIGLPLNSSMSKAVVPLLYTPFFCTSKNTTTVNL